MERNCCEIARMFGQVCLDCNPKVKRAVRVAHAKQDQGPKRGKNPCAKTRAKNEPYEVWVAGDWTWNVLKKWQVNDDAPYARWFCNVVTPIVPEGEMGDVYVAEIKAQARRVR